jgi:hypothetical protein
MLFVPQAAAQPWKFVVITDSQGYGSDDTNGVSTTMLNDIASYVANTEQPELVLFTGDLVSGTGTQAGLESQLTTWRNTMAPIYNAGIDVYAIRGSHDVGENVYRSWSNTAWNNVFAGQYAMPTNGPTGEVGVTYSFTYSNAFFAGIDCYKTAGTRTLTINQTWLDGQLAANTKPHVFAFSHTQVKKVEHGESLDNYPTMRNTFVGSLRSAGGRSYFCGHMHLSNFTRLNDDNADPTNTSDADDFYQIIAPPSDLKYYDWDPETYDGNAIPGMTPYNVHNYENASGYTLVEVDGLDVTITFMRRTGPGSFAASGSMSYLVPEPASVSLLTLGALALIRRRRLK